MSEKVDFAIPAPIKDYIFDLHDATRRSLRLEDVQQLYEIDFKEITERFFSQSAWPDSTAISPECGNDTCFLVFYGEMIARHVFTKLKPQMNDFLASWANYVKLFEIVLLSREEEIALTTQWIYDIIVEFVYQFQGFCQYRSQVASRTADDISALDANRDVWSLAAVARILKSLVSASGLRSNTKITTQSSVKQQFGYFAAIELARLECLLSDYSASLAALSNIDLHDRMELFDLFPSCHVNIYYHTGVCQLLLRRYGDAADTFSSVIMYITRMLKPAGGSGSSRYGSFQYLNKILDKILALTAVAVALAPSTRLDDQVRELLLTKLPDKFRKLQEGDLKTFREVFENACPKFISPSVPDYAVVSNCSHDAFAHQVQLFCSEVSQIVSVLKLRSYLRLYASIEISKLARFNNQPEEAFVSQLVAFKHKAMQCSATTAASDLATVYASDVHYFIQDGNVVIDTTSSKGDKDRAVEKFYMAGVRKHAEISNDINRAFEQMRL